MAFENAQGSPERSPNGSPNRARSMDVQVPLIEVDEDVLDEIDVEPDLDTSNDPTEIIDIEAVRGLAKTRAKMTQEVNFDLEASRAQTPQSQMSAPVEAPRDPYAVMSARVKPQTETFWDRMKRSLFGASNRGEKPAQKQTRDVTTEALKQRDEMIRMDRRADVQNPVLSQETRQALLKDEVMTARKPVEPTQSFFSKFWNRVTGKTAQLERSNTYGENARMTGRVPDYTQNPPLENWTEQRKDEVGTIRPEDLEEVSEEVAEEEKAA